VKKPNTEKKITSEKEACEIIELATLDIETLARAFEAVEGALSDLSDELEAEITIH
jgi:hypothetical protein